MPAGFQAECIGLLPDSYAKDGGSNNYRLFACITPEYGLLMETMAAMGDALDIDKAEGAMLDAAGANVGQARGQADDGIYRALVKTRIAANMSDGTIDTMLGIMAFLLNSDDALSRVTELHGSDDPDLREAAAISVSAPMEGVLAAGVTLRQFVELMELVKPAGVRLRADLQGSFEFVGEDGYGAQHESGFADEAQETGGTLGVMADPAAEPPLPI
jgi:hypothetical protein